MEPLVSLETKSKRETEVTARQEYCSWTKVPEKDRTRLWCGDIGLSAAQSTAGNQVKEEGQWMKCKCCRWMCYIDDKNGICTTCKASPPEPVELPHPHEPEVNLESLYHGLEFSDDMKGGKLNRVKVIEARRLEIAYFKKMGVYTKVPRGEARAAGCKVITTKWIDTNKGSEEEPNYRSRLVGRELNLSERPDLFAATPPLESLRYVVSKCASSQNGPSPHRLMAIDVSRAYFYAKSIRPVFIEIPSEDRLPEDEGMVSRLNLSLYGTRDAAQNWSIEYTRMLEQVGFVAGKASPCNFTHRTRDLSVTVHGDDFTTTGPESELIWLRSAMEQKYEIKSSILGPESRHVQEVKILGRTLRWTEQGI